MIASNLVSFFSPAVKMPPHIRTSVASYRQITFWYRQISQRQLRYLRTYLAFGFRASGCQWLYQMVLCYGRELVSVRHLWVT